MSKMTWLLAAGALFVAGAGCSNRGSQVDDHQTLLSTLEARQQAVSRGDMKGILSFWTDDVVIHPVAAPVVTGIAAVGDYVRRNRQELGRTLRVAPDQIVASQSGDLGYIVGTYESVLEIHSPRPAEPVTTGDRS